MDETIHKCCERDHDNDGNCDKHPPQEEILFCCSCFASSDNSSWGEQVIEEYCMNCGQGPIVKIPRMAVNRIRSGASWVGKRYYPHREDRERNEEIRRLRGKMTKFPGRSVEHSASMHPDDVNMWVVTQKLPRRYGITVSTSVEAASLDEAFGKARTALPYYDVEDLDDDKETGPGDSGERDTGKN